MRYFISGGTGFIGRELVRQLLASPETESITCLTRGRDDLIKHPKLNYYLGDITEVSFPEKPTFYTHLIHGAADANDALYQDKTSIYYNIVEGTERILNWGWEIPNILVLSSGGASRETIYGKAKKKCEQIALDYRQAKIVRLYSLIGNEIPLNGQFALGRFVWQAMNEGIVKVVGGQSTRTYIDVRDCVEWLLTIFKNGNPRFIYDVAGSEQISISELARMVADVWGVEFSHVQDNYRTDSYSPDILPAMMLGCRQKITLMESLENLHAHLCHTDV